ncbi:MAG: hypothetical protein GY754_43255 [bacterium]|nr:hypothetical protein [bacterium]
MNTETISIANLLLAANVLLHLEDSRIKETNTDFVEKTAENLKRQNLQSQLIDEFTREMPPIERASFHHSAHDVIETIDIDR